MKFWDNYLTRQKRKGKAKLELSVNVKILEVIKLRGFFNCFQIKTSEGELYKTVGMPSENKEMFYFLKRNIGKELAIKYQKVDTRCSDWFMRIDGFLYYTGKLLKKLGARGDYGTPKRYLELVKAEAREDFERRFMGIDICVVSR